MTLPRLKAHLRVAAMLRRAAGEGVCATVARRGDADAGAIAVKVFLGAERAQLYVESRDRDGAAIWRDAFEGPGREADIDAYLTREAAFDSDLWILEIEDREGRAFLD